MKVLFVTTECEPFAKTGGLGDVCAALPRALRALGADARILLPLYPGVPTEGLAPVIGNLPVTVANKSVLCRVLAGRDPSGTTVYFLDQPHYFGRPGLYGENGREYADNSERYIFLNRAVLEFLRRQEYCPDILHVHDWFGGLLPVYLRTLYSGDPRLARIRTVLTIHNVAYQGSFPHMDMRLAGLPWSLYRYDKLEAYGRLNFLKGGIAFADRITTVSPQYAEEIRTPAYGYGLDGALRHRGRDLCGIINGIDGETWNPATDPHLPARYTAARLGGKRKCKEALAERFGLPVSDRPLVGVIARLSEQKGFELIIRSFLKLMALDVRFVLLGSGDPRFENAFRRYARRFPDRAAVHIGFSEELAHLIEAGSDIYLMPSRFEPCGLNQLYSLRYGTVPVVHAVGGLKDTVKPWNARTGTGTGFLFTRYRGDDLLAAVARAVRLYGRKRIWLKIVRQGMAEDWTWTRSAKEYLALYRKLLRTRCRSSAIINR